MGSHIIDGGRDLARRCLRKYKAGQKEYGTTEETEDGIDYFEEMLDELADMANYIHMFRRQCIKHGLYEKKDQGDGVFSYRRESSE